MTDWRDQEYGEREFGLVPDELRARSWMPRELTLTLEDANTALDCFERAGVTSIQWEALHGSPEKRINGMFSVDGVPNVLGSREDHSIAEARQAMDEEVDFLRSSVKELGEILFCLMVID